MLCCAQLREGWRAVVCFGHKGLQQELRASALLPLPCCCLPATACLQVEAPKPKAEPTAVLKAPAAKQQTAQAEKMTESKQAEEKAEETGRRLGMNMALGLGLLGAIAAAGLVLPSTIRNLLNRCGGDGNACSHLAGAAACCWSRAAASSAAAGAAPCLPSLPIAPLLASRLPGAALISDIDKLLTELPSSEAQQLRKDAASIIAAVGAQRSAVEKAMQQVGKY